MACEKKTYTTEAHARVDLAKMKHKFGNRKGKGSDVRFLRAYQCRDCGLWHLGREWKSQRAQYQQEKIQAKEAARPKQKPHSWAYLRKRVERIGKQIEHDRQKRIAAINAIIEAERQLEESKQEYIAAQRAALALFFPE